MGVKWTCALFCLLGIAFIQIDYAGSALAINRRKRDVKDAANSQHSISTTSIGSGGPGTFSSSSSSSSTDGVGGSTYSSSGPGSTSVGSRSGFGAAENVPYTGYSGTLGVPYAGQPQNFAPFGNVGQSWSAPANQGQGFPASGTQNADRNVGSYPNHADQNAALQAYVYNLQNFLQQSISALQAQQEQIRSQFPSLGQPFGQNNRLDTGSPFNNFPNNFGLGTRGQFGNDFGNFPSFNQRFPNSGFPSGLNHPQGSNFAFAESVIGPQGGYQKGEIGPISSPGIVSRFAETLPASQGGTYGTGSFSSSKTAQGPDGKVTNQKTSTTWTNNNGKVTTNTVHDP